MGEIEEEEEIMSMGTRRKDKKGGASVVVPFYAHTDEP